MIVYILLLLLGLSLLAFAIYCLVRKRFLTKASLPAMLMVSFVVLAFPTFSVIYHQSANESEYVAVVERKNKLVDHYLAASNQKEKEDMIHLIESHNRSVEECARKANNPWVNLFSYRFYAERSEELIIHL